MKLTICLIWALNTCLSSSGLNFISVSPAKQSSIIKYKESNLTTTEDPTSSPSPKIVRRALRQEANYDQEHTPKVQKNESHNKENSNPFKNIEEEHDKHLKTKISILVQQTIHDTTKKIEDIQRIKTENRDKIEYKAGFLINLIKKSKDVVNELFNVGVKHKDDWKALEQMKTYELLVHSNVDTDNLVKQLVEIHKAHQKRREEKKND